MRRDSWDPSQQIQGLKCPSQPNPNKNNIETCSVKLPKKRINLFSQQLFNFLKCLSLFLNLCFSRHSKSICISQVYFLYFSGDPEPLGKRDCSFRRSVSPPPNPTDPRNLTLPHSNPDDHHHSTPRHYTFLRLYHFESNERPSRKSRELLLICNLVLYH